LQNRRMRLRLRNWNVDSPNVAQAIACAEK
jgi:hypothetical protein